MSDSHGGFFHKVELSAVLTVIGITILFLGAVILTLVVPEYVDTSWKTPSSPYQVQMYEVADPNVYIARASSTSDQLEFVHHLHDGYTLLAFHESPTTKIVAPKNLEKFITKDGEQTLKLTSKLLLLRRPTNSEGFNAEASAKALKAKLQADNEEQGLEKIDFTILELYDPQVEEAFAAVRTQGIFESYVDQDYEILDEDQKQPFHKDPGVIYVDNPHEYRIKRFQYGSEKGYFFDPEGEPVTSLEELKSEELGFRSRKELISLGETIFAHEGCYYCHTDQTRTLIQDCVVNGTESYAAPPSQANEYIYQRVTYPGTRRIGPDLSRVGIKRPGRDWHQAHFWQPKNTSIGSIMPAFQHFFDADPRGAVKTEVGIPSYKFEAIFQYLMTKGTRITPPTEAWWIGKDPIKTTEIIDGSKRG